MSSLNINDVKQQGLYRYLAIFITIVSLMLPGQVLAASVNDVGEQPSTAAMVVDAVVARPLLFVATVVGSVVFVISSPFSALGGNIDEAADNLVVAPAKATFTRCLGCEMYQGYEQPAGLTSQY